MQTEYISKKDEGHSCCNTSTACSSIFAGERRLDFIRRLSSLLRADHESWASLLLNSKCMWRGHIILSSWSGRPKGPSQRSTRSMIAFSFTSSGQNATANKLLVRNQWNSGNEIVKPNVKIRSTVNGRKIECAMGIRSSLNSNTALIEAKRASTSAALARSPLLNLIMNSWGQMKMRSEQQN